MRAAQNRGAHLAAWSMFTAMGVYAFVWLTLVSGIVWLTMPRPGTHVHMHPGHFHGPMLFLFGGGVLVVAASLVVLGLATWWIRSDVEPATEAAVAVERESV